MEARRRTSSQPAFHRALLLWTKDEAGTGLALKWGWWLLVLWGVGKLFWMSKAMKLQRSVFLSRAPLHPTPVLPP